MNPFRVDFPVPQGGDLEASAADDGQVDPQVPAGVVPEVITPETATAPEPEVITPDQAEAPEPEEEGFFKRLFNEVLGKN